MSVLRRSAATRHGIGDLSAQLINVLSGLSVLIPRRRSLSRTAGGVPAFDRWLWSGPVVGRLSEPRRLVVVVAFGPDVHTHLQALVPESLDLPPAVEEPADPDEDDRAEHPCEDV